MSNTADILERGRRVLIQNYARLPIVMARGEGSHLWDSDGKRYIDLFAGFGGGILGHCHPALVAAVAEQANRLWHVGNTFYSEPQIDVAERLNWHAFPGQAFFCHGGADADEAACKLARLAGALHSPKRWKIVSLTKSFHGRTLAMISATGNPAIREGFQPDVPGFIHAEAGDFDSLVRTIDDETAGVLIEPIQGEGGVNIYPDGYLQAVRKLCDERKLVLIFDEVWTGCGRTGRWFGHQLYTDSHGMPIQPDIMTLGKAIGGGLPVGVMFAKPELAKLLVPGKHGSTLGANQICMAASRALLDVIERENLVARAAMLGEQAVARLRNEKSVQAKVAGIRGRGLFIGVELKNPPEKLVERALGRGVVVNVTAKTVIRLAPPLNIDEKDLNAGLDMLTATIAES